MQLGQRDIDRHNGGVNRNGETEHEELVHRFPALPHQAGQRIGGHEGSHQRDQNGGGRHDDAVEEVHVHVAGVHGLGVVAPQPVLRKPCHVLAEDLRIVFEGEGEHPVDREQADDRPDDESCIDEDGGQLEFLADRIPGSRMLSLGICAHITCPP